MTTGMEISPCAAGEKNRQIPVIVSLSVANRRTVADDTVVKQRAISFLRFLQSVEDVGELGDVVGADHRIHSELFRIAIVVRNAVVAVPKSKRRVGAIV